MWLLPPLAMGTWLLPPHAVGRSAVPKALPGGGIALAQNGPMQGIGVAAVSFARFEPAVSRPGPGFRNKVYTPARHASAVPNSQPPPSASAPQHPELHV